MKKLVSVLLTLAVVLGLSLVPMVSVSADEASGSVSLSGETPIITAISVSPDAIDFGQLMPGDVVSAKNIVVENIGSLKVNVDAGLDPAGTVFDCLELSDVSGPWSLIIEDLLPTDNETFTTALKVPKTYIPKGAETATLIFEATSGVELYDLTTSISPEGSGSIEPSSGTYSAGTVVDLEATAASGWEFASWTGTDDDTVNPTTVTMDSDKSVTATFAEIPVVTYTLSISSTEGGSVTTPGEEVSTYDAGTVVDLVAEPDEGYKFANWSGDVGEIADVDAASTTITMNDDYAIVANFKEIPPDWWKMQVDAVGTIAQAEAAFTYTPDVYPPVPVPSNSSYELWVNTTVTDGYRALSIPMDSFYSLPLVTWDDILDGWRTTELVMSDDGDGKLYVVDATGDVDVFSETTEAGTVYTIGDSAPDPAGSALVHMPLQANVWLQVDTDAYPDGPDPLDNTTWTQEGGGVILVVPLDMYMTTAHSENLVTEEPTLNWFDGKMLEADGVPFAIGDGDPADYVGTTGTVVATGAVLDLLVGGMIETDVQFVSVQESSPAP